MKKYPYIGVYASWGELTMCLFTEPNWGYVVCSGIPFRLGIKQEWEESVFEPLTETGINSQRIGKYLHEEC